jgi:hypothetical protein
MQSGYTPRPGSVQQGASRLRAFSSDAYAYPIEGPFEEGTAMHTIHPHSARVAGHNRKVSFASSTQQQNLSVNPGSSIKRTSSMKNKGIPHHKRRISFPTSGLYTQPIAPIDQYSSTIPSDGTHSQQYQMLFSCGALEVDYALRNKPFVDMACQVKVPMWGVVRIGNVSKLSCLVRRELR